MTLASVILFSFTRSDFNVHNVLQELQAFSRSVITEAQTKSLEEYDAAKAEVRAKVGATVKNVRLSDINPSQCVEMGQIYALGERWDDSLHSIDRYLSLPRTNKQAEEAHTQAVEFASHSDRLANTVLKHTNAITFTGVKTGLDFAKKFMGKPFYVVVHTKGINFAVQTAEKVRDRVLALPSVGQDEKVTLWQSFDRQFPRLFSDANELKEALARVDSLLKDAGKNEAIDLERERLLYSNRLNLQDRAYPVLKVLNSHGSFDQTRLRGKVVLLDFFAHYCGPCIAAFPRMKELYRDFHGKGLEMVGVTKYYGFYESTNNGWLTQDEELAKMDKFFKKHDLPWPVTFVDEDTFQSYGVLTIPLVVLIDKKGKVRTAKLGYRPDQFVVFRKEVERLLAE